MGTYDDRCRIARNEATVDESMDGCRPKACEMRRRESLAPEREELAEHEPPAAASKLDDAGRVKRDQWVEAASAGNTRPGTPRVDDADSRRDCNHVAVGEQLEVKRRPRPQISETFPTVSRQAGGRAIPLPGPDRERQVASVTRGGSGAWEMADSATTGQHAEDGCQDRGGSDGDAAGNTRELSGPARYGSTRTDLGRLAVEE